MSAGGQLLAHLVGDYCVQSHFMAQEKTKRHGPALAHAVTYTACFLPLTRNPLRLAVIGGTHFVIDRYRLARYLVWAKNQLVPAEHRYRLSHADGSGYHAEIAPYQHDGTGCHAAGTPPWMGTWLMIVADNCAHGCLNALALSGTTERGAQRALRDRER